MWPLRQSTTAAVGGWASCPVCLGNSEAVDVVPHPHIVPLPLRTHSKHPATHVRVLCLCLQLPL